MSMSRTNTAKGPWTHRFLVRLFSVILAVLVYWLLDFVVDDIQDWPFPTSQEYVGERIDQELVDRDEALEKEIDEIERDVQDLQARQQLLRDSTNNLQQTLNQLLENQRLTVEKGDAPSAQEMETLAETQQLFLDNQKEYQSLNQEVVGLDELLRDLRQQQRALQETLEEQREPIREEYDALRARHDLLVAGVQLAFLIPLLLVAAYLFVKGRKTTYALPVYAFGIAVALKVAVVMHKTFPEEYFKYGLILVLLAIVLRILVYLLRVIAFPKRDWLLKQYREAYESFLCPVCGYPIRRGPLRFASWTPRTLRRLTSGAAPPAESDEAYTCPACTTRLYEECSSCHAIRPALLPACDKCGAVKTIEGDAAP